MSQYITKFPSFAGRDRFRRAENRRSCCCGLCWSLAAADGSIQAKLGTFVEGESMEIFHGEPDLKMGQLDQLDNCWICWTFGSKNGTVGTFPVGNFTTLITVWYADVC